VARSAPRRSQTAHKPIRVDLAVALGGFVVIVIIAFVIVVVWARLGMNSWH